MITFDIIIANAITNIIAAWVSDSSVNTMSVFVPVSVNIIIVPSPPRNIAVVTSSNCCCVWHIIAVAAVDISAVAAVVLFVAADVVMIAAVVDASVAALVPPASVVDCTSWIVDVIVVVIAVGIRDFVVGECCS